MVGRDHHVAVKRLPDDPDVRAQDHRDPPQETARPGRGAPHQPPRAVQRQRDQQRGDDTRKATRCTQAAFAVGIASPDNRQQLVPGTQTPQSATRGLTRPKPSIS